MATLKKTDSSNPLSKDRILDQDKISFSEFMNLPSSHWSAFGGKNWVMLLTLLWSFPVFSGIALNALLEEYVNDLSISPLALLLSCWCITFISFFIYTNKLTRRLWSDIELKNAQDRERKERNEKNKKNSDRIEIS